MTPHEKLSKNFSDLRRAVVRLDPESAAVLPALEILEATAGALLTIAASIESATAENGPIERIAEACVDRKGDW